MLKTLFASSAWLLTAGVVLAQEWPANQMRYANFMPADFATSLIDQFDVDEIAIRTYGTFHPVLFQTFAVPLNMKLGETHVGFHG